MDDLADVSEIFRTGTLYGISMSEKAAKREEWKGYHDYKTVAKVLAPIMPWVEIGGGSGALAEEIRRLGGRCVTTDNHSWHTVAFGGPMWENNKTIKAEAERVARLVSRHPTIGLISAWPSYNQDWCFKAVNHLQVGQIFAYVGEGPNGCTGDDQLHDLLAKDFETISVHEIDVVYGIHDKLYIYRRYDLSKMNQLLEG